MKPAVTLMSCLLVAALSACNPAAKPADEPAAADTMAEPAAVKHAKGVGTVTAVDPVNGKVTLDHGAIAELQWPPMTMGFGTRPDMLADVKVGDKLAFELDWDGKAGTITALSPAP